MNTKYLSDGRKVAVIGQLNNIESIVQEVFVTPSGYEIPSGERFTTKSLHDAPVMSYAAKEEARAIARLDRLKAEESDAKNSIARIQSDLSGYREMFKQVKRLANNLSEDSFDTLCGVMSGTFKWVVSIGYGGIELEPLEKALFRTESNYGNRRFDMLKLISVMGQANGDLEYRIHRYSDDSGGCGDKVEFFETKTDALKRIRQITLERILDEKTTVYLATIDKIVEMGVEFTHEEIAPVISENLGIAKGRLKGLLDAENKGINSVKDEIKRLELRM